ncbi:MAG: restriction endonuclease subunit S [Rikenellaceae bacterium]
MRNWQKIKLGDVCNYTSNRVNVESLTLNTYISTENMQPMRGGVTTASSIATVANVSAFNKGNVLVSNIRPYFKKIWFADRDGGCSNDVLCFVAKQDLISARYLYYLLSQDYFFDYVMSGAKGSKMPRGDKQQIMQFEFDLPAMEEQRRIAEVLGSLDDKIELNNRINKNLEEQASALFKRWFVDFEFPNTDGNPYKSAGGKFIDSPLGQIPLGWRVGSIYDIADVIYGAPYKSKLFNEEKMGLPLIRIRDLKTNSPQYFTEEILPNTEYITKGDIVAGMDAEFIPYLWQGDKGVLNQRVCKFNPNSSDISNYFVYFAVKPHLEFIQFHKVGTTVSHMGKSDIDRIEVLIPTDDILLLYKQITEPILTQRITLSTENQNLAQLRDSLLPKLMNNEIK